MRWVIIRRQPCHSSLNRSNVTQSFESHTRTHGHSVRAERVTCLIHMSCICITQQGTRRETARNQFAQHVCVCVCVCVCVLLFLCVSWCVAGGCCRTSSRSVCVCCVSCVSHSYNPMHLTSLIQTRAHCRKKRGNQLAQLFSFVSGSSDPFYLICLIKMRVQHLSSRQARAAADV